MAKHDEEKGWFQEAAGGVVRWAAEAAGIPTGLPDAADLGGTVSTSEEGKEKKLRFQEQCFLMDAWKVFANYNRSKLGKRYKNIISLDDTGSSSAGLVSMINTRFDESTGGKGLQSFLDITPSQRAALVPKIKLYSIKYKKNGSGKAMVQDLVFRDWTHKSSIEQIISSRHGRGDGAGLLDFSYEFDGKQPATTENMIKVKISMLFADFEQLVRPQRPLNSAEKSNFNASSSENINFLRPKFLDLLTRDIPDRVDNIMPFKHKIKAVVGWNMSSDAHSSDGNFQTVKKYIDSGALDLHMVLHLLGHDIKFREDGRIELHAEYRAALDGLLDSEKSDVLMTEDERRDAKKRMTEVDETTKKRTKELEKRRDNLKREASALRMMDNMVERRNEETGDNDAKIINPSVDDADEAREEKLKSLKKIENLLSITKHHAETRKKEFRLKRYRSLLEFLTKNNKIRYITLDPGLIREWHISRKEGVERGTRGLSAEMVLKKSGALSGDSLVVSSASSVEMVKRISNMQEQNAKSVGQTEEQAKEAAKEKSTTSSSSEPTDPMTTDVERIDFMFLGDLLDAASRGLILSDSEHEGKSRLIAGPVEFYDPATGKIASVNLADLPVSIKMFTTWFWNNVVRKDKLVWSMADFLKQVVGGLVFSALGDNCFLGPTSSDPLETTKRKTMPEMSITPLVINLNSDGEEPYPRVKGFYPRTKVKSFASSVRNILGPRDKVTNNISYIVITGILRGSNSFNNGNRKLDQKMGIYHFGIGKERGLIKSINFEKVTLQHRAESLVLEHGQMGVGQLRELYNANVNMIGNTLFRNGQCIYINPSTMGIDRGSALELGMGGYYIINKVSSELSKDGYSTTLECKFNNTGARVPEKKTANEPFDGFLPENASHPDHPSGISEPPPAMTMIRENN